MNIRDILLPDFDREAANTRKILERVPEALFGWKPHEKSMPLGRLASHIANLPTWAAWAITLDSFDIHPPGGERYSAPQGSSTQEIMAMFENSSSQAHAAISRASDEHLMVEWSLKFQGRVVFTHPRFVVVRRMALEHGIHHRAQLGVYLRLNGIPIPGFYGPSADEA